MSAIKIVLCAEYDSLYAHKIAKEILVGFLCQDPNQKQVHTSSIFSFFRASVSASVIRCRPFRIRRNGNVIRARVCYTVT